MKFLLPLIVGVVILFAMIFVFEATGVNESLFPWLIIILNVSLGVVFTFKKLNEDKSIKETIADGVSYVKTTSEDISSLVDDKDAKFYAIAEQEINDDVVNNGLWSQALVKAKGDENLRKVEYMKLRVKQLKK